MTNGGGAGVMATDALIAGRRPPGRAVRTPASAQLDAVLPPTWSHANPVDIIGDAPAERYVDALEALLRTPEADAVLFMHAPTAIVPSAEIARGGGAAGRDGAAATSWPAGWAAAAVARGARSCLRAAGIPTYDTPEEAVRAFMQIVAVPPQPGAADAGAALDRREEFGARSRRGRARVVRRGAGARAATC